MEAGDTTALVWFMGCVSLSCALDNAGALKTELACNLALWHAFYSSVLRQIVTTLAFAKQAGEQAMSPVRFKSHWT